MVYYKMYLSNLLKHVRDFIKFYEIVPEKVLEVSFSKTESDGCSLVLYFLLAHSSFNILKEGLRGW